MQHALVANKMRVISGVQKCGRALETKNVECANVFLPFLFHAHECCMAKIIQYMCAAKIAERY